MEVRGHAVPGVGELEGEFLERLRVAYLHGMPGAGYRLPSCVGKDVREFIGDDAENPGAPLSFKEENRNVHAGEQFIG